ncbi:MAG: beta-glucosidase [Cellvibrionaceae bacterium]|nr:beta-glucosidase [Cellvibrionaceae bacterium]
MSLKGRNTVKWVCGVSAACTLLVLQACTGGETSLGLVSGTDEESVDLASADQLTQQQAWPQVNNRLDSVYSKQLEARVATLLSQMSIEEKVGQLIQPEIKYITPEQVKEFHIGSVLNGGGTAPNNDKFAPVSEWVALADAYYTASKEGNSAGVPLIWGSDAVHGHNNVVGATLFPHNIGLGAARDEDLIRRIGVATAKEVAVTGIDWTFAPTVAVVRDDRWGRTYESYSEDPAVVKRYAKAMVEGLQGEGDSVLGAEQVVATAKHFLGDGGTYRGIDRSDTRVSEDELRDIHAAGFIAALESGVQTVMASFNSWNGVKMHGNPYLLTQVLKERMGFDGFVVGDWNGHRQVPGCTVTSCAQAINAGLDMFMVPSDWQELYVNTLQQARDGVISAERLDDAVTRILRVKVRAGLMDKGLVSERSMSAQLNVMGGDDHRRLAREAVRKSLVLLKNNQQLLPLKPQMNVLVAGDGAHDIGKQSGGWTLSWQGTGNKVEDFPGAQSIFEGIEATVDDAGGKAVLSVDGSFSDKPDVAIVVIGEEPYAEWHGDVASIEYQHGRKKDLQLLQSLQQQNIPVVTVFLSGRPLWINKELNQSDAFVAAWLPGSEGAGIADVLFTDAEAKVRHDFVGKLSFTWPQFVHQTVLNLGDENYQPLFEYGYGLTYQDHQEMLGQLTEEYTLPESGEVDDAWLFVSRTLSPWQMFVAGERGEPVEVTGNRHKSVDEIISIASVDKESQEDARGIVWNGAGDGRVYLQASTPQDLSLFSERQGQLQMDIKIDRALTDILYATMDCGSDCDARLALNDVFAEWQPDAWHNLAIDLQCFGSAGVDFSQIQSPLGLQTRGSLAVTVANVKILPGEHRAQTKGDEGTADGSRHPQSIMRCEG